MKHAIPDPVEILEQLAEKVVEQIDRGAIAAYDASLRELVSYHRFLLSAYSTKAEDGAPFNYAQVGVWFSAPHEEWIRQYRRLFDHASAKVGDEIHFVASLAYLPYQLLPDGPDEAADEVINTLLRLGPILVHSLEAWVIKHAHSESSLGGVARPLLVLAGSDRTSYSRSVLKTIGAWEDILDRVQTIYDWRRTHNSNQLWTRLAQASAFLEAHLHNSGYMLATAIWNGDELGMAQLRDALVRWPENLRYQLQEPVFALQPHLLSPEILNLQWPQAHSDLQGLVFGQSLESSDPRALFYAILLRIHDDVVFLTASVMLRWFMDNRLADAAAAEIAKLIRRELIDPHDDLDIDAYSKPNFRNLFGLVVRIVLAGERFDKKSYGASLDKLVRSIDDLSERAVVPGRSYTPSTVNDRDELFLAFLAVMQAYVMGSDDDSIRIIDAVIARGGDSIDRKASSLLRDITRLSELLEAAGDRIDRAAELLTSGLDLNASRSKLKSVLRAAIDKIDTWRRGEWSRRPIDQSLLRQIRIAAEGLLFQPPAGVPFFEDFRIERFVTSRVSAIDTLEIGGLPRSDFVQSEGRASNLVEMLARRIVNYLARCVMFSMYRRPREIVVIGHSINEEAFWRIAERTKSKVVGKPILLVSDAAETRVIREIAWKKSSPLWGWKPKVDREKKDRGAGRFLATIEAIDVYSVDLPPGTALLFGNHSLQSISYGLAEGESDVLNISYSDINGELPGSIRVQFAQAVNWEKVPIVEYQLNPPPPLSSD